MLSQSMDQAITLNMLIGQNVRARRAELGLTQDEVARRLWHQGFTRSVVDAIERGTRDLSLLELASVLGALS